MHLLASRLVVICLAAHAGVEVIASVNDQRRPAETYPGWTEIVPGGETTCARGDEFAFFVAEGDPKKVVVDFIGGGACWSPETCAKETATFADNLDLVRDHYRKGPQGIYNRNRAENPVKDWTHVVIPYCTGDIHWGNSVVQYQKPGKEPFQIAHKGAVNSRTVLNWMTRNLANPEKILVTGCSAGAYGSIYWTPHINKAYPGAQITQLADSGTGVITREFLKTSFANWNAESHAPRWIPDLDPGRNDWTNLNIIDIYRIVADFYPRTSVSHVTTNLDIVQVFFYEIMGGESDDWSGMMRQNLRDLSSEITKFSSFVAAGEEHCVLPYDRFYSMKSDGTFFREWFGSMISGETPESVECEGCSGS